tara:strand:- start:11923 stop:12798 length:876 start_codon:yes stop_codon:yes gene_type:complete
MSLKKKISIKPIHLMVGGKKKEKKEKRKRNKTLESLFKPNKVKRELLEKIKRHQQEKKKSLRSGNNDIVEDFSDSFQDSLLYLNKVSENKKKQKTLKNKSSLPSFPLDENSYKAPPSPPYGILKGGSKPLYSEYRKTMKKSNNNNNIPKLKFNFEPLPPEKPSFVKERQNKLAEIKQKINPVVHKPIIKPKKFKKTKTLKRKLILGKNKGKVSVLIKNRKTRKKIKNDTLKLKKKSLSEIKQYLRIHNLIKIGSNAPESVIRETFENAFLSGNIYNKNAENLIHNYINDEI